MSQLFTTSFWSYAFERAVKTGAQSLTAAIGTNAFSALDADWIELGSIGLGGFVLSVLTSLGTLKLSGE